MGEYELGILTLIAWGVGTLAAHYVLGRMIAAVHARLSTHAEERILAGITDHRLLRFAVTVLKLLRILLWIAYALGVFQSFAFSAALVGSILHILHIAFAAAADLFVRPLFHLGEQAISLQFLLILVVIFIAVSLGATAVRRGLRRHLLSRLGIERGLQEALATGAGYIFLAVGGLIALDLVGLDLSTLALVAGALSIGIGFGLQNIANNFISGLILLIERPIKVGDRIEVGDVHGEVTKISARSTSVRTNDNIDIIVPNAELISGRVTNWSQRDRRVRFRMPVGVAYGTDVRLAMRLMEEAGSEVPEVLRNPAPAARFLAFGDSALELELRVWTVKRLHTKGRLVSDVNLAIYEKFDENDIAIPFPQRDLHLRSWPVPGESVLKVDPDSADDASDDVVQQRRKGGEEAGHDTGQESSE